MEIFIDTSNVDEIVKWYKMGVIDGVTTNPSIMYKDGVTDIRQRTIDVAKAVYPLPVSVEVTTNDLLGMLEQGRNFAELAGNIVIKIPQTNQDGEPCYEIIRKLEEDGIEVNATVALSMSQLILAVKAGATYVSLFYGRIADEGGYADNVVSDSANWIKHWGYSSKIIAGSIRSVGDVLGAAMAGAHVITIPPAILSKMTEHKYTRATVKQFIDDFTSMREKGGSEDV